MIYTLPPVFLTSALKAGNPFVGLVEGMEIKIGRRQLTILRILVCNSQIPNSQLT
jgi:hypothetical protein